MSALVQAAAPALPLHTAGPYVAAAYIVFVVLVLCYVLIMGLRTSRTERELGRLRRELEGRELVEPEADREVTADQGVERETVA